MSTIIFELKEKHLKLLKFLRLSVDYKKLIISSEDKIDGEQAPPFGEDNLYDAMNLILNGRPSDFNPLDTFEETKYTDEEKAEWDTLYSELPLALEIILYNGHFNLGKYKARFHDRQWKEI